MSEETGLEGTGFEEPGTGGERAGEAPSESPADAARRALRAARAVRGAADDASPPDAVADAGTPPAEERDSGAAKGAFGETPQVSKPSGSLVMRSPWLIQTG